jgi:hypothetical protein
MRTAKKQPTIIDALINPIHPNLLTTLPLLNRTAQRAKQWVETGTLPDDNLFKDVLDHEL